MLLLLLLLLPLCSSGITVDRFSINCFLSLIVHREAGTNEIGVLLAELKACRNLDRGRDIHAEAVQSGNVSCLYVANSLVTMYARCGSMPEAHQAFDTIKRPSVVSWNALILGYAENGQGSSALDMFERMKAQKQTPNSITFLAALKACTTLAVKQKETAMAECRERGRRIHMDIGCQANMAVLNSLIAMYSRFGSMSDARQVFDSMKHPNVVSWTALILGYAENGEGGTALEMFARMRSRGCAPDRVTFLAALKACITLSLQADESRKAECLLRGKQIHSVIGFHPDMYVLNTLIDMYAKCGSMGDAHEVFRMIERPDVVSWTALVLGYAENGEGMTALDLFERMRSEGIVPNSISFIAALKACTSLALKQGGCGKAECRKWGKQIHLQIGTRMDIQVQSALIDMYSKCGSMNEAQQVFDSIEMPDVVCWTTLVLGYADNGEAITALDLFAKMKTQGVVPNSVTYLAALKACTCLNKADCKVHGIQVHSEIGFQSDIYVQNSLIDMYAKCGCMVEAREVFDNIKQANLVSWNSLILGYVMNGEGVTALCMFAIMKSQGYAADCITCVAALKACSFLGALESGRRIHAEMDAQSIEQNAMLVTSLVDFYSKCGSLTDAQKVFDSHCRTRDLTTWNALLTGYGLLGDSGHAVGLFKRMQDLGFQPNAVTLLAILTCCSHAGLSETAKECFEVIAARYSVTLTVEHYTCMLNILGLSNKLDEAVALLRGMPCRPDSVTWMTLLYACRRLRNAPIGSLAFTSVVSLDETNGTAYLLMAYIYQSRGMREEQETVLGMRRKLWKEVEPQEEEQCYWTDEGYILLVRKKRFQLHEILETPFSS